MEPLGSERHRRSPKGERAGASESIEATASLRPQRVSRLPDHTDYPRREWSRRESSDIDEARRVRFRGETESIEAKVKEFPEESHATQVTQSIPGGNRTHI